MKTKKKENKKNFDAVKFMKDQRNKISKDIMKLNNEEIIEYFNKSRDNAKK